ncbi:CpaF/VirB11 family protein [Cytobacillus horneckiae]|uniref:Type IV secretion protein n=1 Tax=Cytobacillus horneckiae TaxID=549687 RepID=A0A2N0Z8C7_9BACI|nr:CpaF/VirB11 family protein [Cytobacillus horneckiae]MEC1158680.1 ATPase, T2SS/T4P/T4SS family [Cytobacillus horneckiae]NRG44034.1 type II/IV secretion system ATPase subunit [Bacillus sp. CRN 9]PKG25765.1 type IV secretion protein [Cytobacillus horneckiae]
MQDELNEKIVTLLNKSFIKPYLENEDITDISYNSTDLWVQHNIKGRIRPDHQPSESEISSLAKKIADIQGKEFANSEPILDTAISNYRINTVHTVVSPSGCTLSVRKSSPTLSINNIKDIANEDVERLLEVLIKADTNIVISGKTGSGKTELQKLLVGFIEDNKKITLIEDTMDSHIKALYPNKDINSWRTLTDSMREKKITYTDLIKAGLRNNPDWMIVAETRGGEARDMVDSGLTDHMIITTLHGKRAAAIPSRIISMIGQDYIINNEVRLGKDIVNTLRFGIYMGFEITEEGVKRYIREIVEFLDYTNEGVEFNTIYKVARTFDEETQEYSDRVVTNSLSEETKEELIYKKQYHKLPSVFK